VVTTAKQERFIDELLVDLNATQAAIRAGYSPKTAGSQAHDLLKKPEIQAELGRRRDQLIERTHIDQDRVISELAALGFSNVQDFLDPETGCPLPLHQVPKAQAAAVKKFKVRETLDANGNVTARQTEIELLPKEGVLEKLGRHLGMLEGQPVSDSGRVNDPPTDRDANISPARRLAMYVLAAVREAQETGMLDADADQK